MKSKYYDLPTIKAIPIVDYLYACGIEPANVTTAMPSITLLTEKTRMPA